jgi:RHS repeat-associated protein
MLTDIGGSNGTASNAVHRYDFLPFGGELLANVNGRTAALGYSSTLDTTNPRFTGQMRDPETYDANGQTALDWFNVRHMSGAQGRFQSPDPGNAGADLANPPTWNGYVYVGNNPLSYIDPSGEFAEPVAVAPAASGSSSFWAAAAGPLAAAAIFGWELYDYFAGGPVSHPLPTQSAGQGVTNPGGFGFSVPGAGGNGAKMFSSSSGNLPKCIDGLTAPTPEQSRAVLSAGEKHYGEGYMAIRQCDGFVCTSIRESLNPSFPMGGGVKNVIRNPGLKPIDPGAARDGDIIAFGTSHMGIYAPSSPRPQRTVLSAQGAPDRPNSPGVVYGQPDWFHATPITYYRVMVTCK